MFSIKHSLCQASVSVNPAVAQERPVGTGVIYLVEVERYDQGFLAGRAGFGEQFAGSPGHEALAPKFDAVAGQRFKPDTVGDGDVAAVGDGMAALDGLPGGMLALRQGVLSRRDASRWR